MLNSLLSMQSLAKYTNTTTTPTFPIKLLGQSTNTTSTLVNAVPTVCINCSSDGLNIFIGIDGTVNSKYGVYKSSNSGSSFSSLISTSNPYRNIAMSSNGQYVYITSNSPAYLYYSSNYGTSFTQSSVGSNISGLACDSTGQNVFVLDWSAGYIWKSSNYGVSFTKITSGGVNIANLCYSSSTNKLYYCSSSSGYVYIYNLNNSTYVSYKPGSGINCSGTAVSSDGQHIYICYSIVTSNQVYYSSNGGSSWSSVSLGSVAGQANIYCSSDGQYVYKAVNNILWYSSNFGVNWSSITYSQFNSGGMSIALNSTGNYLFLYSSLGYLIST